jgi:tRNA nucleotidyltransferase (CCA-adding enzyme)
MGAKGARDRERSFFSNPTPAAGPSLPQLLSLPSSDLDVTLSSVSGFEFATAFHAYLSQLDPPIPTRSIGKVAANPDQSKHLETAATKILGLDLDFVALRSESYADGSRIPSEVVSLEGGGGCIGRPRTRAAQLSRGVSFSPKQRLGTAEEDALRRDITINTLFYNVHSRQVEDWTGKVRFPATPNPPNHLTLTQSASRNSLPTHTQGLHDMAAKLIRTPLDPRQTFQDDPLRVLRCIRFASRFGYELVPELVDALKDESILVSPGRA